MKRLQFYRYLYVSPNIRHPEAVKWRLNHDAGNLALYVITLCGEGGHLQFFHCVFLQQRRVHEHCPMIVGIAEGREEAIALVQRIVEDAVRETGKPDPAAYLASQDPAACLASRDPAVRILTAAEDRV